MAKILCSKEKLSRSLTVSLPFEGEEIKEVRLINNLKDMWLIYHESQVKISGA